MLLLLILSSDTNPVAVGRYLLCLPPPPRVNLCVFLRLPLKSEEGACFPPADFASSPCSRPSATLKLLSRLQARWWGGGMLPCSTSPGGLCPCPASPWPHTSGFTTRCVPHQSQFALLGTREQENPSSGWWLQLWWSLVSSSPAEFGPFGRGDSHPAKMSPNKAFPTWGGPFWRRFAVPHSPKLSPAIPFWVVIILGGGSKRLQ